MPKYREVLIWVALIIILGFQFALLKNDYKLIKLLEEIKIERSDA